MTQNSFVFGDVHGQDDLLCALLKREGLMDDSGKRLRPNVRVISLGDLGHFANYSMAGKTITKKNDAACYQLLFDGIIDVMVMGNHDMPVVNTTMSTPVFQGYIFPSIKFRERMESSLSTGKIKFVEIAQSRDPYKSFLLTHAGLNDSWNYPGGARAIKNKLEKFSQYADTYDNWAIIHGIGHIRGGFNESGGIIWRDIHEGLYDQVRQIFGHTSSQTTQAIETQAGINYCLDISKSGGIAGIWLPDERVVTI